MNIFEISLLLIIVLLVAIIGVQTIMNNNTVQTVKDGLAAAHKSDIDHLTEVYNKDLAQLTVRGYIKLQERPSGNYHSTIKFTDMVEMVTAIQQYALRYDVFVQVENANGRRSSFWLTESE